jgi:hypothetical protein
MDDPPPWKLDYATPERERRRQRTRHLLIELGIGCFITTLLFLLMLWGFVRWILPVQ